MAEIHNPVDFETLKPLNSAEQAFVQFLLLGMSHYAGNGKLPESPIESGDDANVIRANVIRFVCHGGDETRKITGPSIKLYGAYINGRVDLEHAEIPYTLSFRSCHFTDSIDMTGAECIQLNLDGSRAAKGLYARRLKVRGDINLGEKFSAEDGVTLTNSNIDGDLRCGGGRFSRSIAGVLNIDGATIRGGVYLNNNFSAEGMVNLVRADIGGDLLCSDGSFVNGNSIALNAFGLKVRRHVILGNDFMVKGRVEFFETRIGGSLICSGNFSNPERVVLDVYKAEINGDLCWYNIKSGAGIVNLSHAKAAMLTDDADSWKTFKVNLRGFVYDQFDNFGDIESRIKWLGNRPKHERFTRQPYEQAAKALYNSGDYNDAREILLEMERLYTEDPRTPRLHKIWRRIWGKVAGYGYRLHYMFYWIIFIILFGAGVFHHADVNGKIIPHQPVALANMDYQMFREAGLQPVDAVHAAIPEYPGFNPLFYSIDVFIPLFSLHQESFWAPSPGKGDFIWWWMVKRRGMFDWWWLLTGWYWVQIIAGWFLTSLLLFYITNLLRRR